MVSCAILRRMSASDLEPTANTGGVTPSPALVAALRKLLRPLVRLLLSKGVSYPYFANWLKGLFVDVAAQDFPLEGKRQTDSRLSLLTGVHRKDVRRLMSASPADNPAPENVSFGARLVARWCADERYADEHGAPLPLPRLPDASGGPSFERLVADESKDIRARVVLDEWLRLGLAVLDEQDRVCLCSGAFVPDQGFDEKVYYLGRNVRDHLAAASHNVLGQQPPFLERCVYSDGLSPAGVAELAAMAEQMGMDCLHRLNRRAAELRAQAPGTASERMSFGIYFYHESEEGHDGTPR